MSYIHGFNEIEQRRLVSQAAILEPKIFEKIDFSGRQKILEVGCGVGAQTEILLRKYPNAHITGIELSEVQLNTAKAYLTTKFDASQYTLHQMDAAQMELADHSFDAIYICWVLEHVKNPQGIIDECFRVLKPGGIISISEVQNNNLYVVPHSPFLEHYWQVYNQLQIEMGGNPYVGVEIGNFLQHAQFSDIDVYAQTFLYDNTTSNQRAVLVDYWTHLMLSGFDSLLKFGKVKSEDRQKITTEMQKVKQHKGVFHYAFIQGFGKKR